MRESNIELLRIVSMFMVLIVHADGAALSLPALRGDTAALTAPDAWQLAVESIVIIGVNCFTMISGYFGIRLRAHTAAAFLFQCLFYSVGTYLATTAFLPQLYSADTLADHFMVLTRGPYWYVRCYFMLMLASPILNAGLDALPRRTYLVTLSLLTAYSLWWGWYHDAAFAERGYSPAHLMLVYAIARYIRLHVPLASIRPGVAAAAYVASTAVTFVTALYIAPFKAFAYNSPPVLAASVSFFCLFLTFSLRSRAVNTIASSAFAVYLLHMCPALWGNVLAPFYRHLWATLSLTQYTLAIVAASAGIYAAASLIDPVRRAISRILLAPLQPRPKPQATAP